VSTYEDRLAALEQKVVILEQSLAVTRSDILKQDLDTRELHYNMTILLGVVGVQGQDIKAIKADLGAVKAGAEAFEKHADQRFDALDKKLDQVLSVLSRLTPGESPRA
jgi:hypothetical protein